MSAIGGSTSEADGPACIAVDWGTSRFRAHLVAADMRVMESVSSEDGLRNIGAGRFEEALLALCGGWLRRHPGLPALMAGMVGSRNGWREAPYVSCPAGVDEIAANVATFQIGANTTIRIVPGVAMREGGFMDVMRGEETQILGVDREDAIVVLPGTHSKWAMVRKGRIESFRTFMTGEFFGLLTQHSLLRLLAEPPATAFPEFVAAFDRGRAAATVGGGLLNRAFHARTGVLAGTLAGREVEPYLSGLLIGTEVAEALREVADDHPLALVADGVLAQSYRHAIEAAGRTLSVVDPQTAFIRGLFRVADKNGSLDDARRR